MATQKIPDISGTVRKRGGGKEMEEDGKMTKYAVAALFRAFAPLPPLLIANSSLLIKYRLCIVWIALCAALLSCATTGGSGEALSLDEAIEQSAEKIAADLPAGSRVAIAAWESPSLGLSDYIMEELTGALFDRDIEVADRQNLEYVYKELNLQMSGEVSDKSARSIGKFLGADMVITGQLTELGGPYRYRTSAVNVETATRDSVSRLDVKGDAALRRMIAALANQKTAVKTASYGESEKAAPKTAGTFLDRGILFGSRGDFALAIEDFTEAIKLDPNMAAAYLQRSKALLAGVSKVSNLDENFDFITWGTSYSEKNKDVFNRALEDAAAAIKLAPDLANAYHNRGRLYSAMGEYDKAISDYNQAIKIDPNSNYAYSGRGYTYSNKKDYDRAIADYNQAIRLDPDFAAAYSGRGYTYSNKKDYDRAIADYNQAIRLDPDLATAYNNRGIAYYNKKDYDRAIADYNQAIRLDPDYANAYNNRGGAYGYKGDHDRAIADYNQAIRLDPDLAAAYVNRGNTYHGKKDYDRAIADYNQAIRLDPDLALAYTNRGLAYYDKKDYKRARADWEQALRIDPNFDMARENLERLRKMGY
jgi:tetratricopeptide (TPR) repeat protein